MRFADRPTVLFLVLMAVASSGCADSAEDDQDAVLSSTTCEFPYDTIASPCSKTSVALSPKSDVPPLWTCEYAVQWPSGDFAEFWLSPGDDPVIGFHIGNGNGEDRGDQGIVALWDDAGSDLYTWKDHAENVFLELPSGYERGQRYEFGAQYLRFDVRLSGPDVDDHDLLWGHTRGSDSNLSTTQQIIFQVVHRVSTSDRTFYSHEAEANTEFLGSYDAAVAIPDGLIHADLREMDSSVFEKEAWFDSVLNGCKEPIRVSSKTVHQLPNLDHPLHGQLSPSNRAE